MELRKNHAVDALRGIASFLVVWSHFASLLSAANFPAADEFYSYFGTWIVYLSRGSAVYFFLISGFVIACKLPVWQRDDRGLLIRGLQRLTRILCIFWCGLVLILICNYVKYLLTGHPWSRLVPFNIMCEFLLIFNFMECQGRLIPPDWYLEVDLVLLVAILFCYSLYARFQPTLQRRLRSLIWLITVPVTLYSMGIESEFITGAHAKHGLTRSLAYFMLGVLACHARHHRTALVCLIINSMTFMIFNDHSNTLVHYFCTNGAVLFAWILFSSDQLKSISELFQQRGFSVANKLSFAVFIFHYFLLTLWISLARHCVPTSLIGFSCFMLLSFPMIYGFAWVFHTYVEKRLMKYHDALWAGTLWKPAKVSPAPLVVAQQG